MKKSYQHKNINSNLTSMSIETEKRTHAIQGIKIVIDSDKTPYIQEPNIFVIDPSFCHMTSCLKKEQFSSCLIKDSSIDDFCFLPLKKIYESLKINSIIEVMFYTPIQPLNHYMYKEVEAALEIAGFVEITREDKKILDKDNREIIATVITAKKLAEENIENAKEKEKEKI